MKLKEVNGRTFQPHVRFVLEITNKMTSVFRSANASTNLKRRCPTSAVIYLLDPFKDIQNHYMHRQFQSACKRHILKMHLPACPLLPSPHFLRPLHVLPGYVMLLSRVTWLRAFALCFEKSAVVYCQEKLAKVRKNS